MRKAVNRAETGQAGVLRPPVRLYQSPDHASPPGGSAEHLLDP